MRREVEGADLIRIAVGVPCVFAVLAVVFMLLAMLTPEIR